MAKGITIKLGMHPMYADWIRHCFSADSQGRVLASEKNPIGLLIKNLLRPQPFTSVMRNYAPGEHVEFILPNYDDIDTLSRNYISKNSEKLFYSKVRRQFYYDLHDFIEEITNSGCAELRRIIILFCETRDIDEGNYKVNTLEREYRRYIYKQKRYKKTQNISSVFLANFSLFAPLLVLTCPFCQLI